jgi:hypothetical protein
MNCYLSTPCIAAFARIDLRNSTIFIQDGLSGVAELTASPPVATDTDADVEAVVLNSTVTDQIPIGARFTIDGETDTEQIHTVTARTPANGTTTNIEFTPALGAGTYVDGGVLTFLPQRIEIKVGDGNLTYTEADEFEYELDRGKLDTVREGDDQPLSVDLEFVYESITTGTGETIAPMDAIKRRGSATEWVSSAADLCEPYAVDVIVEHVPPCGTKESERTTFPDFRSESRAPDFSEAQISVSGRCNVRVPITERF